MSKAENPNQGREIEIISIDQREIELLEKNRKINIQKLFTPEGMDSIICTIKKEVADFKADVSTKEGRAKIVSMAAKVAKCKSPIEKLAKEAKDESQKIIAGIQVEWKRYEAEMDTLRDEIRKPVDDIEEREAIELKARQDRLAEIESYKMRASLPARTSKFLELSIRELKELVKFEWNDFAFKAENLIKEVTEILNQELASIKKQEADAAELAQLKKEKAERDQKDHEEKIAREAAEKAKREAEEEAERERKAAIEREAKIEADKKAAEERAKEAERLAIEQAAQAELARIVAEKKAKEDAEKAAADAVKKEQERVAEQKRLDDAAAEKLAANKKHRAKINNEAANEILKIIVAPLNCARVGSQLPVYSDELHQLNEKLADVSKIIISAIARGEVPHVQINY